MMIMKRGKYCMWNERRRRRRRSIIPSERERESHQVELLDFEYVLLSLLLLDFEYVLLSLLVLDFERQPGFLCGDGGCDERERLREREERGGIIYIYVCVCVLHGV